MSKRHSTDSGSGRVEPEGDYGAVASMRPENIDSLEHQKVIVPKKGTLAKEIKSTVRETFFPDNPLRGFNKETPKRRFYMALTYLFPVLQWGRGYNLLTFKDDLIAGLTIGSLCIPQDIGYAKLAGLPPIYGLCKSQNTLTCLLTICTTQTYSDICLYT